MTGPADPTASAAVLIGVHDYQELSPLPAVERNVHRLGELFTDGRVWGLPEQRCHVLPQPADLDLVVDKIYQAGEQATDTLVVYYAGHGLTDHLDDGELYLSLPKGEQERYLHRSLSYGTLKRILRAPTVNPVRKVIILDCCWSGRAIEAGMSDGIRDEQLAIPGVAVLTASAARRKADAPVGADYTAFTGALIDILGNGIPEAAATLSLSRIYQQLLVALRAAPTPQYVSRNAGGDVGFVRNVAWREPAGQAVPGVVSAMRLTDLRRTGRYDEARRLATQPATDGEPDRKRRIATQLRRMNHYDEASAL